MDVALEGEERGQRWRQMVGGILVDLKAHADRDTWALRYAVPTDATDHEIASSTVTASGRYRFPK